MNANVVRILSARGSRNIPVLVIDLYFLAYQPSYQSVKTAIKNITSETRCNTISPVRNRNRNTGESNILITDKTFGTFIHYLKFAKTVNRRRFQLFRLPVLLIHPILFQCFRLLCCQA